MTQICQLSASELFAAGLDGPCSRAGLYLHHVPVHPVLLQKSFGPALFGYFAVCQNHDLVRSGNGAHPVGDDQYRFIGNQPGKGRLDQRLVFHVQRRGGLIQQDDRRVFEESPSDGDALAFPAGQFASVFADQGIKPFGELFGELVAVCKLCRL